MHGVSSRFCRAAVCAAVVSIACRLDGGSAPPPPPGTHVGYYVSTTGTANGTGTTDDPWDLSTALAGGNGAVHPGDTVWVRVGTYTGAFRSSLDGTSTGPITFRAYPGERVTIDGTLRGDGSWLVFWGFEVMQSTPAGYGLEANTSYGRFVNMIIHDAGTQGITFWTPGVDAELYGCIVYNNGTHERLDHGVYVHNESGTKRMTDNVFFNNYAMGIHVYQSSGGTVIRNIVAEGNVSFNNGTISATAIEINLLFNGEVPITGMVGKDNMLFYSPGTQGINMRAGTYGAVNNKSVTFTGNYAAGGMLALEIPDQWDAATVQGNTLIGGDGTEMVSTGGSVASYAWSGNEYYRDPTAQGWRHGGAAYTFADWKVATGLGGTDRTFAGLPSSTRVFVRPNKYEPGRALVIVYNWANDPTVSVNASGILTPGASYDVHNVQDIFGVPVTSGTYGGGTISIPMGGVNPPHPIGRVPPKVAPKTGPAFDVFLLTSTRP